MSVVWGIHQSAYDLIINFENLHSKSKRYDYFLMILSFVANIGGTLLANYLMRGGKTIRGIIWWGSLMMIATPTTLHWLNQDLNKAHISTNYHGIWISLGVLLGNLGEGLAMCGCTTYISLLCKSLESGHLFGHYFLIFGVQQMILVILDMKYVDINQQTDLKIYYWIIGLCIIASCAWLLMDKERTHHLEEKWFLEEIKWNDITTTTVWCIGFFCAAETFGWGAEFMQMKKPYGLENF